MSSGDLLKKLFISQKKDDVKEFYAVALELIAEEERKNHHVLAQDLLRIIENGSSRPTSSVRKFDFDQLPQDRERGTTLLEIKSPEKYFHDIIINESLKEQMESILNEYKALSILQAHGLRPKSKLLLAGPPGCGKTLCAEILSSELGLPLIYTRFDAVISSYLGETAANLRKVFDFAQKGTWVVFFDEFDAIGKSRDDIEDHGELKRVVNTFLQLLDNFVSDSIFIAATNHEKLLDQALWRRFDDILFFDRPTQDQIRDLIDLKLRSYKHQNLKYDQFLPTMLGWSHSDVEKVCFDAMKISILNGNDEISESNFELSVQQQVRRIEIIKQTSMAK